ncbi:hypothetical protein [Nocardia africana]
MSERQGYTLADLQRMREEMEMSRRLYEVAREHRLRKLIGDDVYDFMTGQPDDQFRITFDPHGLDNIGGEPTP